MATFKSQANRLPNLFPLLMMLVMWILDSRVFADDQTNNFTAKDQAEFLRTQRLYEADPKNDTNAWQFAAACFDYCQHATNDDQLASIAKPGIAAGKAVIERNPKSAAGHYYMAMDLGELAEAEAPSFASYRMVKELEREFKTATALDEYFDYGGPVRNLGLLYRDAPGWPISIGSKRKARENLERAVVLAPDYPENLLNLAESYLKWSDRTEASQELNKLDALWSKAQQHYAGPLWDEPWHDWSIRRLALHAKLDDK
jgi:tetratricopeptide (TPR) repeat protein